MASYYQSYSTPPHSFSAFKDFSPLNTTLREHLINVYSSLALGMLAASVGSYVHMYIPIGGLLTTIASIALIFLLFGTPDLPENSLQRKAYYYGFCFLQGVSIGPLIDLLFFYNPDIIVKALSSTFVVFSCFTASALLSKDRTYLYLGGFLSSAISTLLWLSFFNIFMRSESVLNFQLYFGLLVLCGFILYDTQLIVEKAKLGSRDYLVHALTLFTDFFGVFIRLLAIFSKNERSNDRDRRRR